jgi:hypothetical protein
MVREKKAARELIEMAHQHFEAYSLIGAVEHVFQMARDGDLPWAQDEVLKITEDTIDQARNDWKFASKNPLRSFRTGREEIDAAQADGFDLIGSVRKLLSDSGALRS